MDISHLTKTVVKHAVKDVVNFGGHNRLRAGIAPAGRNQQVKGLRPVGKEARQQKEVLRNRTSFCCRRFSLAGFRLGSFLRQGRLPVQAVWAVRNDACRVRFELRVELPMPLMRRYRFQPG